MFRSAALSSLIGARTPRADSHNGADTKAAIGRELNLAAMEGDDERVKRLLEQLLQGHVRPTDRLQAPVAALEELFYAMRTMAVTARKNSENCPQYLLCQPLRLSPWLPMRGDQP